MGIAADIQKLSPGAKVILFELDATEIGGSLYRFHSGTNELLGNIIWQGATYEYTRFPIEATGFEWNGKGTMPMPIVKVGNITGVIDALCLANNDLVGAKVTRKKTFVKYLDAVNFAGGVNPTANPATHFPDEVWFIDRKSGANKVYVEFELGPIWNVQGVMIPRRQIVQNVCPWRYRKWNGSAFDYTNASECGYTGGAMFTSADVVTSDPALDSCSKRLSGCKLRFGTYAELPYGGFPAAGLIR